MSNSPQQPPPGWYPDPAGADAERYWDGVAWSQSTRDRPRYAPPTPTPSAGGYGAEQRDYSYAQAPAGYGAGAPDPRLAGFGARMLGFILDSILIWILMSIIGRVTGLWARVTAEMELWMREVLIATESPGGALPGFSPGLTSALQILTIVSLALWFVYRFVLYLTMSATVGQLALGLRVVKVDKPVGTKLTAVESLIRALSSALLWGFSLTAFINPLFALFTKQKQTLSDLIAKTRVVKIR
ncbi:RDD family protein [Tessaracoccus flavus]|uniref:Uncharacterized protein n=1 Tax=Tessaracoccus flavus TaxID=1610493 RepID=A0A1Q2CFV7_9ACTN|nr:RDD family protein [Tessaracoccus flavus]AQP44998.1 hypothetical protein RPIT_09540 [Tessaracoccus flavus]SDY59705.1 Uncharacterized membrane protein YckC, RDD family [Tessaracoccus flavus]